MSGSFVGGTAAWRHGRRFPKAKSAAMRALEFDSTLAEAHASLAHIHFEFDHDWQAAEREYRRAIELDPRYPTAHHWYGGFLSAMGRHEEALQQAMTARTLDPLSPIIQTWMGLRYYFAGKYDDGDRGVSEGPGAGSRLRARALASRVGVRADRPVRGGRRGGQTGVGPRRREPALSGLARSRLCPGGNEEAKRAPRSPASPRRPPTGTSPPITLPSSISRWAIRRAGLDWLERAYDEQSPWIGYLRVDPRVDPVRSQPRFERLLEKARL